MSAGWQCWAVLDPGDPAVPASLVLGSQACAILFVFILVGKHFNKQAISLAPDLWPPTPDLYKESHDWKHEAHKLHTAGQQLPFPSAHSRAGDAADGFSWGNLLLLRPRVIAAVCTDQPSLWVPQVACRGHQRLLPHLNLESRGLCIPGCVFKLETASVCKEMLSVGEAEVSDYWVTLFLLSDPGFSCLPCLLFFFFPSLANGRPFPSKDVFELMNKSIATSSLKPGTLSWLCHSLLKLAPKRGKLTNFTPLLTSRLNNKYLGKPWELWKEKQLSSPPWVSPVSQIKVSQTQREGPFSLGTCSHASLHSTWRLCFWELGWPGEQLLFSTSMKTQWLELW